MEGVRSGFEKKEKVQPKGRPPKRKIVHEQPRIDLFSPLGRPGELEEITITVEQYEAIRLADYMGMEQKKAAEMMGISQQSFSRVIRASRKKVADAIVNAKIMRLAGGKFIDKRSIDIANKLKRQDRGEAQRPVPS